MKHSEEVYKNNPLHGVSLEDVLKQMVAHYGWEILYAYLNLNCFKTKPSIASSLKFLKKTEWAKEKVEAFYMYQYKSLPKADSKQFELPPRDRIVPLHQKVGEPRELSLEDAENLRLKRAKKTREKNAGKADPWGNKPANPWGK
ncbi:VF530 family DNA-binding protein [Litorilituus sediminis]|uniref:DUF2132 domain-containing protein n=1 Tax=Litorilituus sediminis TaxID=718192 RepID=A0A4P6PB27_9GAMM|nr:VF530 family DNA-binding protein [Litorilituus sediminis]QBG36882.1 DUF2132 domain-containing protein [Litorilituus sediminis]